MIKRKYLEERFPNMFIFGEHPGTDNVDLATVDCDIICNIPREDAKELMLYHNTVLDEMFELLEAFSEAAPEAFKKEYYK